jgi:hypothetical protein
MRALLGSPLHRPLSRWFAVLAWTGRRSGRRYSTPVSYVRQGTTAWVTTGDRWWHNLSGGAPVAIRIRGRWHEGRGVAITDRLESHGQHSRLFGKHAWFRLLAGIPRARGGGPDPAALDQALTAGRVLIRIELSRDPTAL